jgi:hypothetical protein
MQEVLVNSEVVGEGTVDGRSRKESHVGAQVVVASSTSGATTAGNAGLDGHTSTDRLLAGLRTVGHDHSRAFVSQHEGSLDHEVAYAPVEVVVNV